MALLPLKELTKLKTLTIFRTKVTDAGLEHLKGLTNLHTLILLDTKITDEGVAELQKAFSDCTIYH